ncbi:MAG TPA: hypothetical protein VGH27_07575 [Streptosporangiaceae bacterium]|jgi:hypothetical protein
MNVSEDEVRAATRAAADVITADQVPPLRLEESLARPATAHRTHRAWLAPAAAAAAVALVAGGGAVLGSRLTRSGHGPSSTSGQPKLGVPSGAPIPLGTAPPYYVTTGNSYAAVRATATGATLARIATSIPFVGVAAAADDRTFVLDAQRSIMGPTVRWPGQPSFSLLRLTASGAEQSLTRITVPALPPGTTVTGLALSSDGSQLAIAADSERNEPTWQEVMIDTLATGAIRTWSAPDSAAAVDSGGFTGSGVTGSQTISWTADSKTLAFDWKNPSYVIGVRLLDVTASGDNLIADSRLAVVESTSGPGQIAAARSKDHVSQCVTDGIITPDGSTLVCGYSTGVESVSGDTSTTGYQEYSTRTGKLTSITGVFTYPGQIGGDSQLYWTDATGKTLIGAIATPSGTRVGIIRGETFTPLPGLGDLGGAAW